MNMNMVLNLIDDARAKASEGIDYSVKYGGVCPICGKDHMPVVTSRPWNENIKFRFHKCNNNECILCRMGVSIKSVQLDNG